MKLGFLSWIVAVLYGLLFLLPLKIKIWKKYGMQISYDEMVKFAEEGDKEVRVLRNRTKIMIALLLGGIVLEFVWKAYFAKGSTI